MTAAAEPPPIPAALLDATVLPDTHLLVWVHAGSARVETHYGRVRHLERGEGVWIPAGLGRRVQTAPASVAFVHELARRSVRSPSQDVLHFAVPDCWERWLIRHYVHQATQLTPLGGTGTSLLDVLSASRLITTTSGYDGRVPPTVAAPPPALPTAPGARLVAEQIRARPALEHSLEQWAALVPCSVSTLRRGFRATGLTFAQWRTRTRLAVACEFLESGYGIEEVATQVGFSSRNGFTRAFGDRYGLSPRDYAARTVSSAPSLVGEPDRVRAERGSRTLARLLDPVHGASTARTEPPLLPALHIPRHTNDFHVLTWTFCGQGYLQVGETTSVRRRGEAVWIPAGIEHRSGSLEGSISLPVADLHRSELALTEPLRAHFSPAWDTYLMHRSISMRTHLRPANFDPYDMVKVFGRQLAEQRARSVPMPRDPRARDAASRFLDQMRPPASAAVDPAVHEAFLRETGMTFARWQNAARMEVARGLLDNGGHPSAVARRVGYTHLRNFTRAFHAAHGVPPSRYRSDPDRRVVGP